MHLKAIIINSDFQLAHPQNTVSNNLQRNDLHKDIKVNMNLNTLT